MKKKVRKTLSVLMVFAMFFSMAGTAFGESLSEAQQKKDELEKSLAEAEDLIDELSSSQDKTQDKISQLNYQLADISEQISSLQQQLVDKNEQIVDAQTAVADAQQRVDAQYADMKLRIQFMYENGQTSLLESMLTAGSMADFVSMAEYVSQVTEYDRRKKIEFEEAVIALNDAEDVLAAENEELEALKAEVEQKQVEVQAMLENKKEELASISEELGNAEDTASIYEAEVQAQSEVLAMIQAAEAARKAKEEEERRAQEEAAKQEADNQQVASGDDNASQKEEASDGNGNNNAGNSASDSSSSQTSGNTSSSGGNFVWPVPSSHIVSSDFGYRDAPTAGASTNHNGIDIAAAYGSDVVATASGTVLYSFLSSTGGNMIIIDHGSGIYSVYMHNSSLLVSAGQKVSAGQTIAKIGSTGISTGNHLHFGISVNGVYVSPWGYVG